MALAEQLQRGLEDLTEVVVAKRSGEGNPWRAGLPRDLALGEGQIVVDMGDDARGNLLELGVGGEMELIQPPRRKGRRVDAGQEVLHRPGELRLGSGVERIEAPVDVWRTGIVEVHDPPVSARSGEFR